MDPKEMALFIPILALLIVGGIGLLFLTFKHLRRHRLLQVLHAERMVALEKGLELPAFPEAVLYDAARLKVRTAAELLLKGLLWLFIGGGFFIALRHMEREEAVFALIPIGIGVAYLVVYAVEGRKLSTPPPSLPAEPPVTSPHPAN